MLDVTLILPKTIDNQYSGNKLSLWFFYFFTIVTLWRSQHHLFAADGGAQSIATIPLDTYPQGAAQTVIGIFALWGLSQLIIALIYAAVAIRYKSLIPFMYLLAIFEYGIRAFYISHFKAVETAGTAPGAVMNLPFTILLSFLLVLSIWRRRKA